jgi:hypothetical protein
MSNNKDEALLREASLLQSLKDSPAYKECFLPWVEQQKKMVLDAAFTEKDQKTEYRLQGKYLALKSFTEFVDRTIDRAGQVKAKEIKKAQQKAKITEGLG